MAAGFAIETMLVGSVIWRSSGDDGALESEAGSAILATDTNIHQAIFLNGNCMDLLRPINHAALHHENGILEQRDVFRGIAIDGDNIGELTRIERADPV